MEEDRKFGRSELIKKIIKKLRESDLPDVL